MTVEPCSGNGPEVVDAPRSPTLRSLLEATDLDATTRKRLAVYGEITLANFAALLDGIVFASCGVRHEFHPDGANSCTIQHINARCVHQRPEFRRLKTRNAANLVADALMFAQALSKTADASQAISRIRAAAEELVLLDRVAVDCQIILEKTPMGEETAVPLPAGDQRTEHGARKHLRVLQEERSQPLEQLTEEVRRLFAEIRLEQETGVF